MKKRFEHTDRKGFWIGFIDFFTAGIYLLFCMPNGMQDEIDEILGHKTEKYWIAYVKGIPDFFIYPLIWMGRIAEEMKEKAIELGLEGPYTSFRHMVGWNTLGLLLMGPAVATARFFDTMNRIETELNRRAEMEETNDR